MYTYLIGWSKHQKFYYGVRFAKNCHPSDLWVTYFTSSKHVKEFSYLNGPPDIIQIRKIFKDANKAREYEHKVLRRLKVNKKDKFMKKYMEKKKEKCLRKLEKFQTKLEKEIRKLI